MLGDKYVLQKSIKVRAVLHHIAFCSLERQFCPHSSESHSLFQEQKPESTEERAEEAAESHDIS